MTSARENIYLGCGLLPLCMIVPLFCLPATHRMVTRIRRGLEVVARAAPGLFSYILIAMAAAMAVHMRIMQNPELVLSLPDHHSLSQVLKAMDQLRKVWTPVAEFLPLADVIAFRTTSAIRLVLLHHHLTARARRVAAVLHALRVVTIGSEEARLTACLLSSLRR